MPCPEIEREEIMNACGVDDFHDGANVIRTACVVGMAKARDSLEPFLTQLGERLAHIVRRMLPISMYLLQKDGALRHACRLWCWSQCIISIHLGCQAQSAFKFLLWRALVNAGNGFVGQHTLATATKRVGFQGLVAVVHASACALRGHGLGPTCWPLLKWETRRHVERVSGFLSLQASISPGMTSS